MAHPAKFTDSILEQASRILEFRLHAGARVLDPFAGTGKGVAYLRGHGFDALGVDLEPVLAWGQGDEWVAPVYQGDATNLATLFIDETFDAIFTSPTYGNRFADKDMRPSCAGTYAKGLQRVASEGSSCHLQWGERYREFHRRAWVEARRVLKPDGLFLLNISDHYRDKRVQPVTAWHLEALTELGFEWIDARSVLTPRLTRGANSARCEVEWLHLLAKRAA